MHCAIGRHGECPERGIRMNVLYTDLAKSLRVTCSLYLPGIALTVFLWIAGCGGVFTEIPELDSPDGKVFAERCAACHRQPFGDHGVTHGVPDPRFRPMEEWQKELSRMEDLMREKGIPPLSDSERDAITRYLNRHAKS
jgi:hypothetical protein